MTTPAVSEPRSGTSRTGIPAPRVERRLDAPQPYEPVWREMRAFTDGRGADDPDRFLFLAHRPVFTQGTNGRAEHVLAAGDIPVVQSDRGGQVTYHGPGQLMAYVMTDIRRLGLGVRGLVTALEDAVIATLAGYGITARARRDAPGVYVDRPQGDTAKIGSIGLRIRRGCSYHGLALNVAMDLEPFARIDPCGFRGLAMTQVSELGGPGDLSTVADDLLPHLCARLGTPPPADEGT
ncbi:lipoate-protein ligase B [Salinisphaera sp. PC39]|uniref:lipoyl(octanoyl) transferase LipB n=1 Tax=Salinisphaera sp. PC39 TaxID=1304156 RepID=UPI00333F5C7B